MEAANKKIKILLKKKLDEAKGLWAEKLPEVLCALHTTLTKATGETPFCQTCRAEAILPVEIMHPTARVELFDAATNEEGLLLDNDLLEEKRIKAHLANLKNKQHEARFYNKRVKHISFQVGEWVMKEVIPTQIDSTQFPFKLGFESNSNQEKSLNPNSYSNLNLPQQKFIFEFELASTSVRP